MTAPEVKRAVRTWWIPSAIVFLTLVIAVNYALLIPSLHQGVKARTRQQSVFPISVKAYTWIANHPDAHITRADLNCFKTGRDCPVAPVKGP